MKLHPRAVGHRELNCYRFWLGYNCILVLRTHPVPTLAPNVTDKSTSTEGIRTIDPHFECPSTLPTELMVLYTYAIDSLHQSVVDHGGQTLVGCSTLAALVGVENFSEEGKRSEWEYVHNGKTEQTDENQRPSCKKEEMKRLFIYFLILYFVINFVIYIYIYIYILLLLLLFFFFFLNVLIFFMINLEKREKEKLFIYVFICLFVCLFVCLLIIYLMIRCGKKRKRIIN